VIRILLLAVLMIFVARAFWQVMDGVVAALNGTTDTGRRRRSEAVKLVRDPVCGTYVTPRTALSATDRGGATHYFCSDECRSKFRQSSR
jgi:YHS domain-containing protein